jgi:hypothetical protein
VHAKRSDLVERMRFEAAEQIGTALERMDAKHCLEYLLDRDGLAVLTVIVGHRIERMELAAAAAAERWSGDGRVDSDRTDDGDGGDGRCYCRSWMARERMTRVHAWAMYLADISNIEGRYSFRSLQGMAALRVLPEDIVHRVSFGTNLLRVVRGPVVVVAAAAAAAVVAVEHGQERDIVFVLLAADVPV